MSSNLSVINFTVGGTLTISGKTTLAETVLSSSSVDIQGLTTTTINITGKTTLKDTLISTSTGSFQGLSTTTLNATSTGSFQGLSTTNLNATGLSTFNSSLPTSTLKPTLDNDFTTKIYVDTADSTNKTYIDTNVSPINKFLFSGLKNSTEDPTITPTNISVGYNTTSGLTTGRNNTVIGQNCMSLTTSSSNNTVFGSSIMQSFNPSGADGSNIAFGRTVLQILKTGTFNVGYGLNVLGSLTNGSFNTALGINAGSSVIGSNNTCIGTNTGQSGTSLFQKSTALGFGSLINASNQIMLGTIDDTVYAPNALFLAGINILTRISDSISTAFTNFLAGSNQWSGSNVFGLIFAGSSGNGEYIKMNNGVMTIQGLNTGIIIPDSSYLKIGNNILNSASISYLNGLSFKSGQVIQMKVFSQYNANRPAGTAPANGQDTVLFSQNFQPKSTNSQIHITFDTNYSLGGNGFDEWSSKINLNNNTGGSFFIITYKSIRLSSDNRDSSMILFPLSGAYSNTALNILSFNVSVASLNSNDGLVIKENWNMTITEVQN